MSQKILPLILASSLALFFGACGDSDNNPGTSPEITCEDDEDCLEEESSSSQKDEAKSSSSVKNDSKTSSSSVKTEAQSSSSVKEDSSSSAKDDKSSSSKKAESSSSVEDESSSSTEESSSSEAESSSSVVIEYASTTPNLADLEVSGDTLFAVFQRQNADYSISHNGLLAMYKLSDGTLLDTIQLATQNPSAVKVAGGNVYVATAGAYDATYTLASDENRGIEKVNLKKKTSSLIISGTKLGGGVNAFVTDGDNKGYALIYVAYGITPKIVELNLSSASITKTIGESELKDPEGGLDFDVANGVLYIGERSIDYSTYEMNINVYSYDGKTLSYISDAAPDEEVRMPYSIATINGTPYVFVSDYSTGKLYVDYTDSESDGVTFYQDSKLAVANGELFVMGRETSAATIAKVSTSDGSATWQVKVSGENPYDMVAASKTTAWVAYYGSPFIELISTTDGSSQKTISTETFCATK